MKKHDSLQINKKNITYEIIDNEVIIIHLEKGHYYSLQGVAANIWADIAKGMTEQMIIDNNLIKYQNSDTDIADAVSLFIAKLKEEELIFSSAKQSTTAKCSIQSLSVRGKDIFKSPVLVKYTDLEELLLLDPVHEVDESGWPNKRV